MGEEFELNCNCSFRIYQYQLCIIHHEQVVRCQKCHNGSLLLIIKLLELLECISFKYTLNKKLTRLWELSSHTPKLQLCMKTFPTYAKIFYQFCSLVLCGSEISHGNQKWVKWVPLYSRVYITIQEHHIQSIYNT